MRVVKNGKEIVIGSFEAIAQYWQRVYVPDADPSGPEETSKRIAVLCHTRGRK